MKRYLPLILIAAVLSQACQNKAPAPAPHKRMGAAVVPPTYFRQVGIDPSVTGLAAAVGEVVGSANSQSAWMKTGINATDWTLVTSLGGGTSGGGTGEFKGAPLADANQTLQPGTDTASEYVQPASAPLTAARTKTLGVTSMTTSQLVRIVRKDLGAFNMTITNGGTGGGTLTTALPPATAQYWTAFTSFYNGTDWIAVGFEYLDPIPDPTGSDPAGAVTSVTGVVLGTGPGTTSTTFGASAKATTSTAGVVPGMDPWYYSAVQAAQALGLTTWTVGFLPVTTIPGAGGSLSPINSGVTGGAVLADAAGAGYAYFPSQYIIQNPNTLAWYFKCRFKQSIPSATGKIFDVGLSTTTANKIFLSASTSAAPVAGKWFAQLYDGTLVTADTGVAENTNWNDLEISHASNGANVIFKLNGTQVASVAPTHLTTTPAIGLTQVAGASMTGAVRKYFFAIDDSGM